MPLNLARVKDLIQQGASVRTAFRQAARENAKALANARLAAAQPADNPTLTPSTPTCSAPLKS